METIKGVKDTKTKDAAVLKPNIVFCISLQGPLKPLKSLLMGNPP